MKEWKNIFERKGLETISNEDVFLAISLGSLDLIKLLKGKTDIINIRDKNGDSTLMAAIMFGDMKLVKYFMSVGVDLNEEGDDLKNLVHIMLHVKDIEIVKYVIRKSNKIYDYAFSLYMLAIVSKKIEVVRELIKAGTDVNSTNRWGDTVLMVAVRHDGIEIVRELIKAEADVNSRNERGETALTIAIDKGNEQIEQELIKAGAV